MSNEAEDQNKARAVFRETIELLEERSFDYAVGGGMATDHWISGVTRIDDIDLVIREEEAHDILQHLEAAAYTAREMEHSWLHKAFKDGVTIDLMFELKNGTPFDGPFSEHRKRGGMLGTIAYVMAPEDQIASLGTVDRMTIGEHWYSMIDIMANNDLDWDYLVLRAQRIPLQMLSVIYFAVSEKVPVQKGVTEQLTELAVAAEH